MRVVKHDLVGCVAVLGAVRLDSFPLYSDQVLQVDVNAASLQLFPLPPLLVQVVFQFFAFGHDKVLKDKDILTSCRLVQVEHKFWLSGFIQGVI